jgi:hypothetical protein
VLKLQGQCPPRALESIRLNKLFKASRTSFVTTRCVQVLRAKNWFLIYMMELLFTKQAFFKAFSMRFHCAYLNKEIGTTHGNIEL